MARQHHKAFLRISPAPQESTHGQLARSLGTFAPVFPKARGLRLQSSSWCAQLSWAPTTMPHPTPVRPSGLSLGSRFPTLTALGMPHRSPVFTREDSNGML